MEFTELDYCKVVTLLDHQKLEYHTYQLPSEKLLHIVRNGIPEPTEKEEVKDDLSSKGFHPEAVTRMRNRKDKRPLHIVLATLPKNETRIYQIKEVISLLVTIEEQRKTALSQVSAPCTHSEQMYSGIKISQEC